jgi:5'-methylthioadenosine phosphorylase
MDTRRGSVSGPGGISGNILLKFNPPELHRLAIYPSFRFPNPPSPAISPRMSQPRIGIIGGSGLYHIEGFAHQKWVKVKTPFGSPSDSFLTGKLAAREVVFLPRHGRGHRILPSELNHRANIWAMKKLDVAWIISVSAVGSLQAKYRPCDIVLPDQFLDRTKQASAHTFFGRGIVGHIPFADPICGELRGLLFKAARALKARVHDGGTYVNMEGPAFSTRAESFANRKLGHDVIGMTNLGEAKCCREAEIAYATMAMITDYDCWKNDGAHVTVEMVVANLMKNVAMAKAIITKVIPQIPTEPNWPCHGALKNAIMTDRKYWPAKTIRELEPILRKYLD